IIPSFFSAFPCFSNLCFRFVNFFLYSVSNLIHFFFCIGNSFASGRFYFIVFFLYAFSDFYCLICSPIDCFKCTRFDFFVSFWPNELSNLVEPTSQSTTKCSENGSPRSCYTSSSHSATDHSICNT